MSAQVEEVTASAQSLAEMAESLRQAVIRFKIEGGAAAPTPTAAAPRPQVEHQMPVAVNPGGSGHAVYARPR
jgi:hypothetical protein